MFQSYGNQSIDLLHTSNVKLCAIWYHFYNLKSVKNTHEGEGVLLLIKLQAEK